jgi:hypothetical protein
MNANQKFTGRLRLLAAKCEGLKEFARGDFVARLAENLKRGQKPTGKYTIPPRQQSTWKGDSPGPHPIPQSNHMAHAAKNFRDAKKAASDYHETPISNQYPKGMRIGWVLNRAKSYEQNSLLNKLNGMY